MGDSVIGLQGYILDLDGTVYLGDRLIPGADSAIAELRARGRRIVFLSNKPLQSRADYAAKLTRLGIPAKETDVLNSSAVLAQRLWQTAPGAYVFAIGEAPLLQELQNAGLILTEDEALIQYVVAAFDRTFDYRKLNIAFQALQRGAGFWATNPDRTCPVDGGEIPDAAAVIAALEVTTGRKVGTIAGKPSPLMMEAALTVLGLPAQSCAMVGDRLETDIRMALESNMTAVLTLSGVTKQERLTDAEYRPHHIIRSLAELADLDAQLSQGAQVSHG